MLLQRILTKSLGKKIIVLAKCEDNATMLLLWCYEEGCIKRNYFIQVKKSGCSRRIGFDEMTRENTQLNMT